MENVVLIVHLILALSLIGVVLMQRSEGGGLGIGGGGGIMSARGAATALGKVTWVLAIAFICTSIGLTIIAAEKAALSSVVDRAGTEVTDPVTGETAPGAAPAGTSLGSDLLPPGSDTAPLLPAGN